MDARPLLHLLPTLALPGASSHLSGVTVLSPRPRVSPSYVYLEEWVNYPSHLPHTLLGALCGGKSSSSAHLSPLMLMFPRTTDGRERGQPSRQGLARSFC